MTSQLLNNLSLIASVDKNKCKNNISQLLLDGKYLSDTKVMTDSFHKYFCSIGKNLQAKFNPYDKMLLLHIYLHLLRTVCFAFL